MASLTTKNFATLVSDWAAAAQAACAQLLEFAQGAILLAVAEAQAGVSLWLQGEILTVLRLTRFATSTGPDVDSWLNDFGLERLPSIAATGLATFSRVTVDAPALVPVGAQVQTGDGSQTFIVTADPTNGAFSVAQNGYLIPSAVASVIVPVEAVTPGTGGNIAANTLTVLQTGISGVDSVTNAAGFITGIDAESDPAARARFILFINQLSKGNDAAFQYAVASLQQGLQCQILNNQDLGGATDNGMVTVFVDDGSGAIPGALLAQASAAINAVRAAGVRVGIYAATVLAANVEMTLGYRPGYDQPTVIAQVVAALSLYINGLGLGNPLNFTRLEQVAYDASNGVVNVTSVTLNGVALDLVPPAGKTVKVGTLVVS
jgi:uncharacterized phage protein gp47/JayE